MRKRIGWTLAMAVGASLVLAAVVGQDLIRNAWAIGPHALYRSAGAIGSAAPAAALEVGGSDGTNLRSLRTLDGDTGGGTQHWQGVVIVTPGAGGATATGIVSVTETRPTTRTYSAIDPDQNEAAADIALNANRLSVTCQSVGTTTARFRVGAATGGTVGLIVAGGTAANDGTGGSFSTSDVGAVYIYDITGAGNADVQCVEEAI